MNARGQTWSDARGVLDGYMLKAPQGSLVVYLEKSCTSSGFVLICLSFLHATVFLSVGDRAERRPYALLSDRPDNLHHTAHR